MPESCRDSALDNTTIYPTTFRSAGSWASLGRVVEMIMRWFNWRHLVVLSDTETAISSCNFGAVAIYNWLSVLPNFTIYTIAMKDAPSDNDIDFYLDAIKSRSRG
jgi:hypothetical protein